MHKNIPVFALLEKLGFAIFVHNQEPVHIEVFYNV